MTRWQVKISPGIMLVIYNATSSVPLKILNIEDGSVLKVSHQPRTMPLTTAWNLRWHPKPTFTLVTDGEGQHLRCSLCLAMFVP